MTTPVPPDGTTGNSSGSGDKLPPLPPNFYAGGSVAPNDPWYTYAQQMFPNTEITPEIVAGLKRNMMSMINNTISQINTRQATANEYNAKVARGEE